LIHGVLLFLTLSISAAVAAPDAETALSHPSSPTGLYTDFNDFNSRIRDGRISKAIARTELPARLAAIRAEYYSRGGQDYVPAEWVFPVAGQSAAAIEKRGNHGFISSGYDFFSGNRHGGHPAYDIFIRDRDQDSRDDRTGTAVQVVSMTGGVVVALESEWQTGSKLRGGKYIWVYDPSNNLLVYYAHNEELFVEPGTVVKPGDLLATMGRSGLNAVKLRSPTHLHFSVLRILNGQPHPVPLYQELQRAKRISNQSIPSSRE